MTISTKVRSRGTFLASAILMLLLFSVGASVLADWMPDGDGLPMDIAALAE